MQRHQRDFVRTLLDEQGGTYAEQAGIRLSNRPGPLYQLLVLSTLLGARISAGVAMSAAKELFRAGYRTPNAMREASYHDRVAALDRGRYTRYGDRTSKMLGDSAQLCLSRWDGNLGKLRKEAGGDVAKLRSSLMEFPGIGPTSADIFIREAQGVWTEFEPYLDQKVRAGAAKLRMPSSAAGLTRLVESDAVAESELPSLVSALVRVGLDRKPPAQLWRR